MALLRFSKKENMANRAWKSFINKLRSKVRDLEFATLVRDSTSRLLHVISRRLIVPFKTKYLQNTRTHFNNSYTHSNSLMQRSRFLEFLSRPFAKKRCFRRHSESNHWQIYRYQSQRLGQGKIKREGKVFGREKEKEEEEGAQELVTDSVEDAWRRVVAASPHLRVDEKASEFIYKFKEEMRMEKERSFLEFQERLIRSA